MEASASVLDWDSATESSAPNWIATTHSGTNWVEMADGGLANVFARNLTDVIPDLVGAGLVVVGLDAVAGFVGSVFVSSLTGLVGFIADFDPSAGWAAAGRGLGELDWRVCREDCNRSMRLISSDCCCGWMSPVRRAV